MLRGGAVISIDQARTIAGACCLTITESTRINMDEDEVFAFAKELGCDGVFVGNEVFECLDPYRNVRSIVEAIRNYNDARILAKVSSGLSDMGASEMELNEVNELNDAINGVG
ncbi:pyridoxal 5'-phosphate synthase-like subunit PDX1.2 [Tanacetum coccineum]